MKKDKNNLPDINQGEDKKKKKRGFLGRFFGKGQSTIGPMSAGKNAAGGLGKVLGKGAAGIGRSGIGRAGFSSASGGFGKLLSSKTGLLGLLLGAATIATGGSLMYTLASNPNEGIGMKGLFQGTLICDMANASEADVKNETGAKDALNNYDYLGSPAGGDDTEGLVGQEFAESANYGEDAISEKDAAAIAGKVSQSGKLPALKSAGNFLGGSSGGGSAVPSSGKSFNPNLGKAQAMKGGTKTSIGKAGSTASSRGGAIVSAGMAAEALRTAINTAKSQGIRAAANQLKNDAFVDPKFMEHGLSKYGDLGGKGLFDGDNPIAGGPGDGTS
ncbi:MAG TPA: hypothetical protein VMW66_03370, partial [Elusimicrobiales bacterium]|nr:hypothetical protein [Elusimicrobiales bacterium]